MKLLQINVVANWGSTGRIAEEIGQCAIGENWESYIAYGRNANESTSFLLKIGSRIDILYHVLYSRVFDRHGLASKSSTVRLIKSIERIKPSIIHLHNIHGYYLNYPILFDYLSQVDIPIVWTLHDCWPFTGHCSHYDFIKCRKWETKCEKCVLSNSYPASWGADRSTDNYLLKKKLFSSLPNLTLVSVSNWLAGELQKSFLKEVPLQVIHNGVDTEKFRIYPSAKGRFMAENKMMILGVASVWSPRKGLKDFIKLAAILPKDCIIVLLGLSSNQIKNLPENVIGITRLEDTHQLAELYSSADVFVNPTWEDNFPTTNIEALACGTPIITYRTGGSIEAVTTETGIIVEQGDIDGLLTAIKQIKGNGKDYYASVCRNRAVSFYNKEERYAEYLQLYKNILNLSNNVTF